MKEKTIEGKKELAWAFYQVLGTFYGIHGPARIMNWLYDVAHGESREISELFPIRPEERAKYEWHGNDAAQPAPQPFFPIDTAPKDGTHILAADFTPGKVGFGGNPQQAYYCVVHWFQWCDGTHPEEAGFYPSTGAGDSNPMTNLTHWQPLQPLAAQPAPGWISVKEKLSLDTSEQVFFYEQEFYVLSNFSAFSLDWKDVRFDTSEAAYHFEKFPDYPDIQRRIYHAPSAHEAFKIAERYKANRREDWDAVKVQIMEEILRAKVNQHEYVRRKLLETGNRELIENSWRDDYWGWGTDRKGQNQLGKLWMKIRSSLAAPPEPAQEPESVKLVGNRPPTEAEIAYGLTLEPLAQECLERNKTRPAQGKEKA